MKKEMYIIRAASYGEAMSELTIHYGFKVEGFDDYDIKKMNHFVMNVSVLGIIQFLLYQKLKGIHFAVA